MKDQAWVRALALVGQLGFSIACPMVAFIAGGAWLDGQVGTTPWLLFLGIFLGLLAAGGALYQLTKVPMSRRTAPKSGSAASTKEKKGAGTNRADRPSGLSEE